VSRSAAIVRSLPIALTAALAYGVGWRTEVERADLLMLDAEDDLFAEALKQLGRTEDDPEVAAAAAELRAPLHENCYLSPDPVRGEVRPARGLRGSGGVSERGSSRTRQRQRRER